MRGSFPVAPIFKIDLLNFDKGRSLGQYPEMRWPVDAEDRITLVRQRVDRIFISDAAPQEPSRYILNDDRRVASPGLIIDGEDEVRCALQAKAVPHVDALDFSNPKGSPFGVRIEKCFHAPTLKVDPDKVPRAGRRLAQAQEFAPGGFAIGKIILRLQNALRSRLTGVPFVKTGQALCPTLSPKKKYPFSAGDGPCGRLGIGATIGWTANNSAVGVSIFDRCARIDKSGIGNFDPRFGNLPPFCFGIRFTRVLDRWGFKRIALVSRRRAHAPAFQI